MSRTPGFCGVILSAGESTRMGSDKALLPWPPGAIAGQTFLSAAIRSLTAFNDLVLVVAGKNEANIAPIVYAEGASLVKNPAPERGQFSSLQVGLHEVLNLGRDAAMVTLIDRPPAKAETLQKLRESFECAPTEIWLVVPEFGGKHGHPILISRELIELFLRSPAEASARDIEHQNQQHIQYVPVDDSAVTLNVDTPQEYSSLSSAIKTH
jgi:molybdenum cofactor cytidylyltransferase